MGSCFRVPGVHYQNFRILGDLMPGEHEVDAKCLQCFPGDRLTVPKKDDFVGSEEESFSTCSSSSSSSGKTRPKKRKRGAAGSAAAGSASLL